MDIIKNIGIIILIGVIIHLFIYGGLKSNDKDPDDE